MSEQVNANEVAKQVAQQISQQIAPAIAQAVNQLLQTNSVNAGVTSNSVQNRLGDIGGTERLEKESMDNSAILFSNQKRTYDEYQHESLESIRKNRAYVEKVLSDAQVNDNTQRNMANQALQNAVETANLVGKQAVRHTDIAVDRQWNLDEHNYLVAGILRSDIFKDAVAAAAEANQNK